MRTVKNLNRTAQGASASTASPRQKAYSTLKAEESAAKESLKQLANRAISSAITRCDAERAAQAAKAHIYKVSLRAIGTWSDDYKSGIYHTDIYTASNTEEAIGMAIRYVTVKFSRHAVVLNDIQCSLLNPAAL